ncbi:hypothetical protein J31TS4_37210 [Paenibacillus sp. J31TS4]|uniref:hypothetical protein n=1 Tax=Paenibacillus sp. J31TS4 TaxID=2807195 RepID=UPI001AFF0CDB|nr:hypothetical protein [Paenibacillus sp. J31TS4]GIP40441.1 hypothetical protein J31TS4_37210 [Paenibacillus sp. J31TS4]
MRTTIPDKPETNRSSAQSRRTARLLALLLLAAMAMAATGCGAQQSRPVKADQVQLVSEPSPAKAKEETKLLVQFTGDAAGLTGQIDIQIDKQGQKSRLLNTKKEKNGYAAAYTFPDPGQYKTVIHITNDEGHFFFRKDFYVQ